MFMALSFLALLYNMINIYLLSPGSFLFWTFAWFLSGWFRPQGMLWCGRSNHMRADCLLEMLILHVQAARTSYRFSSKADHWAVLILVQTYIYVIHFDRLYTCIFHFYAVIITFKQHPLTQSLQQKPRECCKRAAMNKVMSDGCNFTNFGYASIIWWTHF